MQTPEQAALSFTGECEPAGLGLCANHRSPLAESETCLHVQDLAGLIRARDAEVAVKAWDEGHTAGVRNASAEFDGPVQDNPYNLKEN